MNTLTKRNSPYVAVVYGTINSIPFVRHLKTRRSVDHTLRLARNTFVVWL